MEDKTVDGETMLLVIDMQVDFHDDEGSLTSGKRAQAKTPFVLEKVDQALAEGRPVVVTRDTHEPGTPDFDRFGRGEFETYGSHCVKGTAGCELISSIQERVLRQRGTGEPITVIEKPTLNAFLGRVVEGKPEDIGATLDELIARRGIDRLEVLGLITPVCVLETARAARERGLEVLVPEAGVESYNEETHQHGLKELRALGAKVL